MKKLLSVLLALVLCLGCASAALAADDAATAEKVIATLEKVYADTDSLTYNVYYSEAQDVYAVLVFSDIIDDIAFGAIKGNAEKAETWVALKSAIAETNGNAVNLLNDNGYEGRTVVFILATKGDDGTVAYYSVQGTTEILNLIDD